MDFEEKRITRENRIKEIEQEINMLTQQRNQIDKQLQLLNIEGLRIQGQLELIGEMDGQPENKTK